MNGDECVFFFGAKGQWLRRDGKARYSLQYQAMQNHLAKRFGIFIAIGAILDGLVLCSGAYSNPNSV